MKHLQTQTWHQCLSLGKPRLLVPHCRYPADPDVQLMDKAWWRPRSIETSFQATRATCGTKFMKKSLGTWTWWSWWFSCSKLWFSIVIFHMCMYVCMYICIYMGYIWDIYIYIYIWDIYGIYIWDIYMGYIYIYGIYIYIYIWDIYIYIICCRTSSILHHIIFGPSVRHVWVAKKKRSKSGPPKFSMLTGRSVVGRWSGYWIKSTMWGPPVISWFINPINYSYKYHKP